MLIMGLGCTKYPTLNAELSTYVRASKACPVGPENPEPLDP